jgi:hypothetical protein
MRLLKDPRANVDGTNLKSKLLLIEVAQTSFAESGIATELEGL